jgi:riboflavin kinase/FMN adenylyltransferase
MKISLYPDVDLDDRLRPAVTLGNFDGVHRGHQAILRRLADRAAALGGPSVAVTFEPHPMQVLHPEAAPRRILTHDQKKELLAGMGTEVLVVVPFTRAFSLQEPGDFVRDFLARKLRAAELVLGGNFRFGRGRAGDLETLRELGRLHDFAVVEVGPTLYQGKLVSSSAIRAALAEGHVSEAASQLGRPHFLDGRVVKGSGRGAGLGFRTANLQWTGDLVLADGVYVTVARVGGAPQLFHPGMSHVGRRPTFGVETRAVETHLFDFSQDLLGEPMRLFFLERLRSTMTFESAEALGRQLARDREEARAFLCSEEGRVVL